MASSRASAVREGRRERRSRELREHIYRTARALFLEHGFENTTVEATFFNHFQSKAAVLQAMTAEVFEHLEALVGEQLGRDASAQDRISAFAAHVAEQIHEVPRLAHDVLLGLMQMGMRSGEVAPHLARLRDPFVAMLREGQARGEVRKDLDAIILAEVVIGALNAAVTGWLGDSDYPLRDRLHEIAAFMGEAISAVPRT
ncbi:MAG: TetR/AcrR family transcriptional regulator [Deltaproteobacteria bacterium]|nr:TetR/AcrR family transcriptional regulator [Deltaproteobacteria bacterium]